MVLKHLFGPSLGLDCALATFRDRSCSAVSANNCRSALLPVQLTEWRAVLTGVGDLGVPLSLAGAPRGPRSRRVNTFIPGGLLGCAAAPRLAPGWVAGPGRGRPGGSGQP